MSIFWRKDADDKVTDAVLPSSVSDLAHRCAHPEKRDMDRFAVATPRQGRVTQPLVHLERELATAANSHEAIYALLRMTDVLLEPALACVVLKNIAEADQRFLYTRFAGRSGVQQFPTGTLKTSASSPEGQAQWIRWIRAVWHPSQDAAEHLRRQAACLPLQMEERSIGAILLWPNGRHTWPPAELQAIYLALSLTASTLHRLFLQRSIQALQDQVQTGQAETQEARERASRAERLARIGQVVSNVAHELSSPLTSILGHAQILQDAQVDDSTKTSLEIIRHQAQQCCQITQNLLGVVRSTAAPAGPIALDPVIRHTIQLMARDLAIEGIEVSLSVEPAMPKVVANPQHLQQVLVNLIKNAREAMVQAGQGSSLRIAAGICERDGDPIAQVTVEDDGPGIAAEIRSRIFEPYYTTKQNQGTGLGLPISRQLMLDMGGDLSLDAAAAQGARFVIHLPIAIPKGPSVEAPTEAPRGEDEATKQACGHTLIIEDDETLADVVERALKGACRSVTRAVNGEEALRRIAERDFDLILLDLRMPKSGGERTYKSLQTQYPHLLSRLVFTTGDVANTETQRWLQSTGCPVLEKPFDLVQLRHLASRFLHFES